MTELLSPPRMNAKNRRRVRMVAKGANALSSLCLGMAGSLEGKTKHVSRRFEESGLVFVERGSGWLRIGEEEAFEVLAPAVFYIRPGPVYVYGPDASGWDERFLTFRGARTSEWTSAGWLPEAPGPYSVPQPVNLARAHARIMDLAEGRDPCDADRAALELEALIFQLHAMRLPRAKDPHGIAARVELWHADPERPWRLADEAAKCGLSYSRFREVFRARYGTSPHQLLLGYRMERAGRLLLERADPVKTVALDAGFSTVEGFYRAFRKHHGESPASFRKRRRL